MTYLRLAVSGPCLLSSEETGSTPGFRDDARPLIPSTIVFPPGFRLFIRTNFSRIFKDAKSLLKLTTRVCGPLRGFHD